MSKSEQSLGTGTSEANYSKLMPGHRTPVIRAHWEGVDIFAGSFSMRYNFLAPQPYPSPRDQWYTWWKLESLPFLPWRWSRLQWQGWLHYWSRPFSFFPKRDIGNGDLSTGTSGRVLKVILQSHNRIQRKENTRVKCENSKELQIGRYKWRPTLGAVATETPFDLWPLEWPF